jgi:hypothetical protein
MEAERGGTTRPATTTITLPPLLLVEQAAAPAAATTRRRGHPPRGKMERLPNVNNNNHEDEAEQNEDRWVRRRNCSFKKATLKNRQSISFFSLSLFRLVETRLDRVDLQSCLVYLVYRLFRGHCVISARPLKTQFARSKLFTPTACLFVFYLKQN